MAMSYEVVLEQLINEGIEGVKEHYPKPEQTDKRDGSIAGFEACRGKNPAQLKVLLREAHDHTMAARAQKHKEYWYYRYYELQIEFVCNAVSACLINQNLPPIIPPTAR